MKGKEEEGDESQGEEGKQRRWKMGGRRRKGEHSPCKGMRDRQLEAIRADPSYVGLGFHEEGDREAGVGIVQG